jgi:predicted secreted protein
MTTAFGRKDIQVADDVTELKDEIEVTMKSSLGRLKIIRLVLTFAIITWLVVFTVMTSLEDESEDDEETKKTHDKYFAMHRIWFGDDSLIAILFGIWYKTMIIIILAPIITKVLQKIRDTE